MAFFSEDKLKQVASDREESKQYTILLVDDDEDNLTNLQGMLESKYNILTANDGEKALDLIKHDTHPERICLIISDQRMPGLTGVEFLEQTIAIIPKTVRIILTAFSDVSAIVDSINKSQIYKFVLKPFNRDDMLQTVQRALEAHELERLNSQLVKDLQKTNAELQDALENLHITTITTGVYWVQIPEANLYILCGCPADIVKHMIRKGFITETRHGDIIFEKGPNAILLSDALIQKGEFSNLAEFPVLQMLYRQGMIIPNHPNNKGLKPILIGNHQQVKSQMEYIYRGNYGLTSIEEITATGVSLADAEAQMRIKMKFAFGKIRQTEELLDACIVDTESVEIRNGVFVRRVGFNRYTFEYKGKSATVDLNLGAEETYEPPFQLGFHQHTDEFFAVLHTGEGDGWDIHRPCMASILIYQGDIYLIDAGPSILQTLLALGIDISEVKGIFHTHAHDDHFAGLPALMQADHKIRYHATPLVRASVAKKLAALMSINEALFYHYFDVRDLTFDSWNDLSGLEVKPLFSPHPVETNIFLFRALGDNGYRTYAHWADLTSFEVLDAMVTDDPAQPGLSNEFYDVVKTNYLLPADLKKVDIGGGPIHGQVNDYATDSSAKIILAHTSLALNSAQKEVGSEATFAMTDVLIPGRKDYLRQHAEHYLQQYFPSLSSEQLQPLLNTPTHSINPGTIMLPKGAIPQFVYLILSGVVESIRSDLDISINLSTGSLLGSISCLNNAVSKNTYRSVSHVKALKFSANIFKTFFESNNLLKTTYNTQGNINLLRKTWLFGERLSFLVQNKVAQSMSLLNLSEGERIDLDATPGIYMLLDEGELQIRDSQLHTVETLHFGDFCGEQSLLTQPPLPIIVKATRPSKVYFIDSSTLHDIPIVHWKLLEVSAIRRSKLDFADSI